MKNNKTKKKCNHGSKARQNLLKCEKGGYNMHEGFSTKKKYIFIVSILA